MDHFISWVSMVWQFRTSQPWLEKSLGSNIQLMDIWNAYIRRKYSTATTFRKKTYQDWPSISNGWCPETRKWLQFGSMAGSACQGHQRWHRNKNDWPQVSSVNGLLQASPIIKIFKIKTWLPLRGYPSSGFHYSPILQHIANHDVQ